jgi:hypothetical protein
MIALGWRENFLQIVLQGVVAGPAATYLFVRTVALLGAALSPLDGDRHMDIYQSQRFFRTATVCYEVVVA